jgi:DNA polymerase III epsilon subunit-like protein
LNQPTNLAILFNEVDAEAIEQVELSDPPHHALLDARMLAELFEALASRFALSP